MIINKIKQINLKIKGKWMIVKKELTKTHYLSIGENCLTDNILSRHDIKSFSTPYSHGRSNLDYAIKLEKDRYSNLLKKEYLYYDTDGELKVVRNNYYTECDNIYNEMHQKNFEFTHHDVINDKAQRESYERKVLRMLTFSKRKKLVFVYHYRNNDNNDLNLLAKKAEEFLSCYQERGIKCEFIFFTQNIITENKERSLTKIHDFNKVKGYVLKTLEVWGGADQDIFWARKDDDLIKQMIQDFK